MNETSPTGPTVALVARDADGIAALRSTRETLDAFGVPWSEWMVGDSNVGTADTSAWRAVVVASPDAALPARLAAETRLPVVRVPFAADGRGGIDLLFEAGTSNLPGGGTAFATVALGEAGAKNAALFVVSMLALNDARLWAEWLAFRQRQTAAVLNHPPLDAA